MSLDPISFVCMPWPALASPSIQLGTLQALAEEAEIPCRSHSFHLQFQADCLEIGSRAGERFGVDDYALVSEEWAHVRAGEWVFRVPPLRSASKEKDARYLDLLRAHGMPAELRRKLVQLRARTPAFLERCADEVLAARPAAVGFTTSFGQTLPSLALARLLKRRDPRLRIVLGGASCEGRMGSALLRAFEFVDVVVRGKVEGIFAELASSLAARARVPQLAGLCFREDGRIVEVDEDPVDRTPMDELPIPSNGEYFDRLAASPLAGAVTPELPIETSRGCWWGAKSHCTFCGLNGTSLAFRSKSAERVIAELRHQAEKHEVLDFCAVDNILDMRYFDTLLPKLRESGLDLGLFYEVKANLSLDQVRALRLAGVRRIQPGIESLSTPALRLMRKGVTAFQNIRLLKWCRFLGIEVDWNLLYGFPGEAPGEYARMAELVPALVHLPAPRLVRLAVDRYSPYHDEPERHGLRLEGPPPHIPLLFDVEPELLLDLSPSFQHSYLDGRDPASYVGPLRERIERWGREAGANRGALTYRRGPGFLRIVDRRTTREPAQYALDELESAVYLACEDGGTLDSIAAEVARAGSRNPSEVAIRAILDELHGERLLYEEGGRYLSLALPESLAARGGYSCLSASTGSIAAARQAG